ncbi:hypothetical protein LEP1GSC050_0595 [Leptospira broomii serovar Hurstbridge str. 5399]|uniref:Uncharacterized protein n=1 Tax=Leptospira broomii serovar Hurstbridge str. 5399 TaxID=1049789 RepID=T0FH52_9LEPT|nr:hypothetical protein LEP1GSC050_0595 [Leptospira broomii serovar Hurstbridge str. 5399]
MKVYLRLSETKRNTRSKAKLKIKNSFLVIRGLRASQRF